MAAPAARAQESPVELDAITIGREGAASETNDMRAIGYVARSSSTGAKTDTPIVETPQSVSVVTRAQMNARNVQREGEAFRYTAGVFAEPYGADPRPLFDAPFIRGFEATTNGLYRDGLREANGVWSRFITEFYGLERVDALKGPSSVLYGQGGPGGVIDKVTKKPTATPRGEISLQGGSFDRLQGTLDVSGPIDPDGRLLYRLVALARDAETQYRYDAKRAVPDIRQYVAPSLSWRPSEDTSLTLLADWTHNRTAGPFTVTLPGQIATRLMTGDPNFNKSDLTQGTIGYRLEHKFDSHLAFRQNLRYGALYLQYSNMTVGSSIVGGALSRTASTIDENLNSFAVDNQAEAKFETGLVTHTTLIGIDYQSATYTTRTRAGLGPALSLVSPTYGLAAPALSLVTSHSHQTATQLGVYAQEQAKFGNLALTLGGRFDSAESNTRNFLTNAVSEKYDGAASYRAGLNYVFDFGLAPYVGYSHGFLPTTGTDASGSPFKPTIAEQFEGGLKFQPLDFPGLFTIAYFDLTQQNVLTQDPARPFTTYKVQTGEVNSHGLEVEASANPLPGLDVVASYTFDPVHVTKDNPNSSGVSAVGRRPIYVARDFGSLWADYTIQAGAFAGFGFGGGARFVGPTYADAANTIRNSPYLMFDAALHYELGDAAPQLAGFRLQLNVNNLFDKRYVACTGSTNCQWGPERVVTASLAYRW